VGNFIINVALRTGTRAAQRKQTPVDGHCLSLNFIHKRPRVKHSRHDIIVPLLGLM
jgi:hypothetical protein